VQEDVHSIFLKDGTCLKDDEARDLWLLKEGLVDKGVECSKANVSHIDPEASLWDWLQDEIRKQGFPEVTQDRLLQIVQDWGEFIGEDIRTHSSKNLWVETSLPGGLSSSAQRDMRFRC
jgi:hypothetical protein